MCNAAYFGSKYQHECLNRFTSRYSRREFMNIASSHSFSKMYFVLMVFFLIYLLRIFEINTNGFKNVREILCILYKRRLVPPFLLPAQEPFQVLHLPLLPIVCTSNFFFFLFVSLLLLCLAVKPAPHVKTTPLLAQLLAPLVGSFLSICQRSVLLGLSVALYLQF